MRLLLSLLTITLALVNFAGGQVSLPYKTSFEPEEGFTDETPLSGDWTTTDASIVTADDVAQSGTQSVRITSANPENIISLAFDPAGNSILFVDYYMQLTASALPGLPSFTQPETTAILAVQPYLTDSGEWVFLDGNGTGSGTWFTVGQTTPLDESNRTGWHRITLRFDLTSNLWDAYIDDKLLAVNLGFVEALIAGSEAINIYGSSIGVAYMDTFSLATTNPLFTDTDLDGIPNAFESSNGLNPAINDRDLDPDLDGLTNVEEYAYETNPSVFNTDEGALNEVLYNRTNWYIDVVNGDDAAGNGSQTSSLQSLSALLAINATNPGYVGEGDTVYLAAGNYGMDLDVIAIAGLTLEGTLDANDEPLTQMGDLEITAENVTVKNLNFNNTSLELKNVSGVLVTNNLFTGNTGISLSLLGSSNNTISYNRFESAQYHSVKLFWDSSAEAASNDNQFIRNYFTHRTSAVTNESIYCTYSAGNNNSLNSRNRFIECAFEEIVSGNLTRVITDEGTWWMTDATAHPYQYSVRFEDCYFKRADRFAPFSEFVVTAGWPDLAWRWDELVNDTWVSMNNEYALTGDYNDWDLEPRIQFIDSDGNGSIIETSHNAGLLISGNSAPEITSAAITSVDEGSLYSYTITATDMDAGDVVTLSAPQLPAWLSFDGTTLSGTPTPTEIGSHTVEIVASDISGATDTHLFTITVSIASVTTPANLDYVSVLFDSNYAYTYAGPVSGTVRGLGSDYADYSIEIISNTDFPYLIDTVDVNADGSWSIGHVGTGQKIARLYSKTDTETVLAEVYGEGLNNPSGSPDSYVPHNDAPGLDAISSPITLEENAGEQTLVLTGIHDGDHGTQAISIHAVSDNPSLIANPVVTYDSANSPETATLRFTPQSNTNGTAIITLTLQDDGGTEVVGGTTIWRRVAGKDTKTVSFEIIVGTGGSSNRAPEIISTAITSVDVDNVYSYTVAASDPDVGDTVTLSVPQSPTWLSFDGAALSGIPTEAEVGTHSVEIVATDLSGATESQVFEITVNAVSAPIPANLDYVSVLFDIDYAYTYAGSIGGTVRGLGSDYADYSIQVIANVDTEYPIGTVDINADGSWSIGSVGTGQKIARLYSKTDTETVLAEVYGEGLNNASGSPESYANQNDAPGLDAISGPITVAENAGEQAIALTGIHDGDHGTQTISISAVSDNPGLIANPVVTYDSVNSPETATLSFTPQTNTSGIATITLTLQDDGGTEFVGGTTWWRRLTGNDTKEVSFEIIVGSGGSGNSAPEITSTAITSVNVDDTYSYTVTTTDPDAGDTVTLNVPQLPTWLSFDGTTLSGTPIATEVGKHTVKIVATDSSGATDLQAFTITVNAANATTLANLNYFSILFDQDYAYGYTSSIGGIVYGLGSSYADYSIKVYSKTDDDYLIETVDINADGTWSIESVGVGQKIARLYSKVDTGTVLAEVFGEGLNNSDSYVNQNDAPGLDAISSPITVETNSSWQTLVLTGIHDGDHGTQNISISAVSEDADLVYNPFVNYDPATDPTTATLRYAPRSGVAGITTIALTLQDDGGTDVVGGTVGWKRLAGKDTRTVTFEIIVGSEGTSNTAPRQVESIFNINVGKDATSGTINLYDAFEDAETEDINLTFDVTNSNPEIVTSEVNVDTLTLDYLNKSGTSTIKITVTDDDPNNPFSTSRTFTVNVKIDTDGDGLNDEFEQAIIDFDSNDGITSLEDVLPEADFDGDGYSNFAEFDRGGSPTDSSDMPDWVAGKYGRNIRITETENSKPLSGLKNFFSQDKVYLTHSYDQTISRVCAHSNNSLVRSYVHSHDENLNPYFVGGSSWGLSIYDFSHDRVTTLSETKKIFEKDATSLVWDSENEVYYECDFVIRGELVLSDEYTTSEMLADAMQKFREYEPAYFSKSGPVAYYYLDPNPVQRKYGYRKSEIGLNWARGVGQSERYPVEKHLLFQPSEDYETEIIDLFRWIDEGQKHTIDPDNYKPDVNGNYYLIDLNVTPDYNRDSKIDGTDHATKAKGDEHSVFKFWVNDDDDSGEFGKKDIPGEATNADANNSQVDGLRDIVDLFALNIDLSMLIEFVEDKSEIEVKLSGSSLNLVEYHDLNFWSDIYGNLNLAKEIAAANTSPVSTSSSTPTPLSEECLDKMISERRGFATLLFEGVDNGNLPCDDPLVFHIYYKGRKLVEIEQEIRLDHVENMYHRIDLTQVVSEYGEIPAGTVSIQTATPNWPDEMVNDKTFVFLHGYRVDVEAARGWNAEVFKRLHQMGSNARFVAVNWDGATGADYHKAVFQAFQTGDALNDALSAYTGDVTVAAHSLGNMVVSHAIQDGGFRPDRYYMINAAVPIEAYNFSAIEPDMVEKDWENEFEDGLEHLFSATWHQLFEGTSDNRRNLRWQNRFDKVSDNTRLYNFFSPGEEVLDKREGVNSASAFRSLFRQGFDLARGSWKAQELVKGLVWSESLVDLAVDRRQAGWNDGLFLSKYPFTRKENITDEQLMKKPYFNKFKEDDLTDEDPTIASAKAAEKQVQYDVLARGIPALSYAAAVDIVQTEENQVTNFDMETKGRIGRSEGQWPTEGHKDEASGDWLHSDFRNVALPYVHKTYQEMINQGNLNEN